MTTIASIGPAGKTSQGMNPNKVSLHVKDAANKNIEDVEEFYEELVKNYPTCGRFWKTYIEHEMRSKRYDKVAKLFQRSLGEVLNVDLYKSYLSFVRETKADQPELILKAYIHTISRVGIDPNAIGIYRDYIQFLKERDVDGSYLDAQKITAVRKAYHEAIIIPMFHIDGLWKEYIDYERDINPIIAEKMKNERSADYMKARRVANEWEVTMRGINRSWLSIPPSFTAEEQRQLEIWRKYIQWEKSNPLGVTNEVLVKRVGYAYKQCLLCFGQHPNFWLEFSSYLDEQAGLEKNPERSKALLKEESSLFDRATKGLMKHNLMIHFAYADFEELRNDRKKALDIYNQLIEIGRDNEQIDLTLVYIQLMRFCRRGTDGRKNALAVFKRARDEEKCGHQVYTAAALMEHHSTYDDGIIACKIFDSGLKKFSHCPDYILSYIHFMNSLNRENNTRVLFERVLTTCTLQPADTIEIWNSFLDFEAGIGDLASVNKVERRRTAALKDVLPNCADASWSVNKYKFQDLYPCSINELRSLGYDPKQSDTELTSIKQVMNNLATYSGRSPPSIVSNTISRGSSKLFRSTAPFRNGAMTAEMTSMDNDGDFPLDLLNQSELCEPDLDQMLPFKPVMAAGYGAHTVPGGVFPPPPAVSNLLSRLPQPMSFFGPFVDIDELCNIIRSSDLDELYNNLVETRREAAGKPSRKRTRVN